MTHQLPDSVVHLIFARKQAVDFADQAKKMADALYTEAIQLVLGTLGIDGEYSINLAEGTVTTPHTDLPTDGEEG